MRNRLEGGASPSYGLPTAPRGYDGAKETFGHPFESESIISVIGGAGWHCSGFQSEGGASPSYGLPTAPRGYDGAKETFGHPFEVESIISVIGGAGWHFSGFCDGCYVLRPLCRLQ